MATYLTDLADVLRAAGLKVVEVPGWKTRGRPGDFKPKGVLCHHTGGGADGYDYAYWMAVTGRSDLSAPLAQLGLDRKGTYYVQAAGRANHAGRCKPIAGLTVEPGETYGDGNEQLIGIEAMNTGSEGWTAAQYGAYVRGVAAITSHYGWRIVLGHKETSLSGKPDPGLIDMDKFRRDVAATEEDDVTPQDIKDIADEILKRPVKDYYGNDTTVGIALGVTLRNSTRAALDATAALEVAKAQALKGEALTADEVKAAVKAALAEKVSIELVVKPEVP